MTFPLATQIALLKPPASFIADIPGYKCSKGQKQKSSSLRLWIKYLTGLVLQYIGNIGKQVK